MRSIVVTGDCGYLMEATTYHAFYRKQHGGYKMQRNANTQLQIHKQYKYTNTQIQIHILSKVAWGI